MAEARKRLSRRQGESALGACRPLGDHMKEASRDGAAHRARKSRRRSIGIIENEDRRIVAFLRDCRIMELMAAQQSADFAQRAIGQKLDLTIAEREFALSEGGDDAEQPRHLVAFALRVDDRLAENHIAAAFAVNRVASSESAQAIEKFFCRGDARGMKFWITPRQPADIAILRRRLVRERRNEDEFRACISPALKKMRIEKRERLVARDGDALPRRRECGRRHRTLELRWRRERQESIEIDLCRDEIREPVEHAVKLRGFGCLNEAEMALRQSDLGRAAQ